MLYRTEDPARWGVGKCVNLTPAELDGNFWELAERLVSVEGRQARRRTASPTPGRRLADGGLTRGRHRARALHTVASRIKDGFVFYRPRLSMRVISHEVERDDWGAVVARTFALEEE